MRAPCSAIALLQQRVGEHLAERRSERHRYAEVHAVAHQAVEDADQRYVGLADGLEEPVFFEEAVVFGVADEGQVRVQHYRHVALRILVGHIFVRVPNVIELSDP